MNYTDCKYFSRRGCTNHNCTFRHNDIASYSLTICTEFLNNNCKNLECPNRHPNERHFSIEKGYKAGGVLPYCIKDGHLMFLVGWERRRGWSDFGGLRDQADTSIIETCAREFCEETAAVYLPDNTPPIYSTRERLYKSREYIKSLMQTQSNRYGINGVTGIYNPFGRYCMILVEVPYLSRETLMQRIEENNSMEHRRIKHVEKSNFKWVYAHQFIQQFDTSEGDTPIDNASDQFYERAVASIMGASHILKRIHHQ